MTHIHRIEMRALAAEEGGGFLAWVPELPGCMSDGESPEEAEIRCRDAIEDWLDQARGDEIGPSTTVGSRAVV